MSRAQHSPKATNFSIKFCKLTSNFPTADQPTNQGKALSQVVFIFIFIGPDGIQRMHTAIETVAKEILQLDSQICTNFISVPVVVVVVVFVIPSGGAVGENGDHIKRHKRREAIPP